MELAVQEIEVCDALEHGTVEVKEEDVCGCNDAK